MYGPHKETTLVEFPDATGHILRGILTKPDKATRGVLMLHGFERNASVEPKFKRLADHLSTMGVASLRLDYAGCGLSDGEFSHFTVASSVEVIASAEGVMNARGLDPYGVVGHSVSGASIAELVHQGKSPFQKIVLIAPALDQKKLLRYWFVRVSEKKKDPLLSITWANYENLLDEAAFSLDCARTDRVSKTKLLGPDFYLENKERDYTPFLESVRERTLLVQGTGDEIVPLALLSADFPNQCVVNRGDHELERPDLINAWLLYAAKFLATSS